MIAYMLSPPQVVYSLKQPDSKSGALARLADTGYCATVKLCYLPHQMQAKPCARHTRNPAGAVKTIENPVKMFRGYANSSIRDFKQ
jgi:hypothetical protein